MAHSYTKLFYQIVFSTKERQPLIGLSLRPRLFEYLGGVVRAEGGAALIINGVEDHVHILAQLRQDKALSDVVRAIKANSSGWIHRTFADQQKFAWQTGYGAFTVSKSQVELVRRYTVKQEEHHRKKSFRAEFVGLLKAHEIEFDERYIWD